MQSLISSDSSRFDQMNLFAGWIRSWSTINQHSRQWQAGRLHGHEIWCCCQTNMHSIAEKVRCLLKMMFCNLILLVVQTGNDAIKLEYGSTKDSFFYMNIYCILYFYYGKQLSSPMKCFPKKCHNKKAKLNKWMYGTRSLINKCIAIP